MRILVLFAHPKISHSVAQRALRQAIKNEKDITFHDLYSAYPDYDINVDFEQQLLLQNDLIILQHPIYWYSSPAIIKVWLDQVLEYNWAYGPQGGKLGGKFMMQALSAGNNITNYSGKAGHPSITDYMLPFHHTATTCGMKYLKPFVIYKARALPDEELQGRASDYRMLLCNLRDGLMNPNELIVPTTKAKITPKLAQPRVGATKPKQPSQSSPNESV